MITLLTLVTLTLQDVPIRAKFFYLFSLPIMLVFGICIPDCRPPDQEWKCYGTFVMAIAMIGLSSYVGAQGHARPHL